MKKKIDPEAKASEQNGSDAPSSSPEQVGYKKPPKHRQFQKGKSGNPKGKPKKKPVLLEPADQMLVNFLHTPVTVIQDGKESKHAPAELFPQMLFQFAKKGNFKALVALYKLYVEAHTKVIQRNAGKILPFSWDDQDERILEFLERTIPGRKVETSEDQNTESSQDGVDKDLPDKVEPGEEK